MTRQLRYLAAAQDDLEEIANYIEDQTGNAALGDAYVDRLRAQCRKLAELAAELGTSRAELQNHIRSTPHKSYIIYFRYTGDTVEIVNVLHASRDAEAHFKG